LYSQTVNRLSCLFTNSERVWFTLISIDKGDLNGNRMLIVHNLPHYE
jgi:hypothetical protein